MPPDEPDESLPDSADTFDFQAQPASNARTPHPYHRRGPSLSLQDSSLEDPKPWTDGTEFAEEVVLPRGERSLTEGHEQKWKSNVGDSTESGTEADDEKEPSLLRLPAPSVKPRKGLKGHSGTSSPLLSPSHFDDEERKAVWEAQARQAVQARSQKSESGESQVRDKFRRRRRAEIYRRATESSLFLTICCLVLGALPVHINLQRTWTFISKFQPGFLHDYAGHALAVEVFMTSVAGLYALYPARIIFNNHAANAARNKSRFYIHIPAAFDPAPLLYPILLPFLSAWSISKGTQSTVLPNLTLGISSIPSKIIPGGDMAWFASPQWLISILPAAYSAGWGHSTRLAGHLQASMQSYETMTFIFPLHQSLLPILHSFTTSSLLPTELHLLSSGLINLYLLSEFPQAKILEIILWVGGLTLVIFCGRAFHIGVAIARIPSWRFRRPYSRTRDNVVLTAVKDCFDHPSVQRTFGPRRGSTSDEDAGTKLIDYDGPPHTRIASINTTGLDKSTAWTNGLQRVPTLPTPAPEKVEPFRLPRRVEGPGEARNYQRYRSNTLPNLRTSIGGPGYHQETLQPSYKHSASSAWSLRSLTWSQATLLRWLLAFYAYMVMIVVIMFPIRNQVGAQALHGAEPFGWALGYLFGDLAGFSSLIDRWMLQSWIGVGQFRSTNLHAPELGRFERWRTAFGPANTRLIICGYALLVIAFGLASVFHLSSVSEVDTRRKVFHGMMVAMFLPTIFIDPSFIALAFSIVLTGFLILDLIRASQLPPLAVPLTSFLAPYVDGRDHRGPVVVSHIFLLIGCAIPLWLSLASLPRSENPPLPGWEVPTRDLSMVSGVVCVGMGDAAASLIGRRYGRRRWCWTGGKSLEGSLAFAFAVVIGLTGGRIWLLLGQWPRTSADDPWLTFLLKTLVAGCGASLTEAVLTGGNDNVIVPVVLWLLVQGLNIS